jgi:hypothetical protein
MSPEDGVSHIFVPNLRMLKNMKYLVSVAMAEAPQLIRNPRT